MPSRSVRLFLSLLALLMVGACGTVEEPASPVVEESAEAEGDADAPAGAPHTPDPEDRDAWSKPEMVYDFIEVEEGDTVLDLMAGGGYNTIRLAERVGPRGTVLAEGVSEELEDRIAGGELTLGNIEVVDSLIDIGDGSVDAVLAVRAYHLFPDTEATLRELRRVLRPGGTVGIVEVRLDQPTGHDMTSHRMGEQTVIGEMEAVGFEYVGDSEILRREDDDYTSYRAGERHMTDRMLLKFRKPAEE